MSVPNQGGPIQPGAIRAAGRPAGVTISDIDIPFTRLVAFFAKASLAAIPATVILWLILMVLALIFGAIFGFREHAGMML